METSFEYNNYPSFHGSPYYSGPGGAAVLRPPPHAQQPQQTPSTSTFSRPNSIEMVPGEDPLGQYIFSEFIEDPLAIAQRSTRSSSEEKDAITPAQSRRKAQNRAAQRAFRERKERRVRELEQKLTDLQAQSSTLHADNERLKRELAKVATENEILRATSSSGDKSDRSSPRADGDEDKEKSSLTTATINGPTKWLSLDVRKQYAADFKTGNLPHRIVLSAETGERLLDTKATWDLIQSHPLFQKGLVDIGDVCERLKRFTKCDGQGPAFEEGRVRKIIEESVACGSDELI
ncbi:bZIP transcription factor [Talaromyces pinophilus]|uniref:BZIP transcription factor n=1 Tax=Talaromyces pinophilus TaxID=128442 RepID=A0A6V8HHK1_TALPI|nr:bZIP transcription factor [Talaromyces pinophilus]